MYMDNVERIYIPFNRFALFLVYFWFGLLKVLGLSPASALVLALLGKTMPFMDPETFMVLFGLFEVLIGILFIFPKTEKPALILLALHLVTTIMPLALLPHLVWVKAFVPTLEGQYILKNVLIMSAGLTLLAHRRRILA